MKKSYKEKPNARVFPPVKNSSRYLLPKEEFIPCPSVEFIERRSRSRRMNERTNEQTKQWSVLVRPEGQPKECPMAQESAVTTKERSTNWLLSLLSSRAYVHLFFFFFLFLILQEARAPANRQKKTRASERTSVVVVVRVNKPLTIYLRILMVAFNNDTRRRMYKSEIAAERWWL